MQRRSAIAGALGLLLASPGRPSRAAAAPLPPQQDRWFMTSDDVRLHYIEAGHGRTLVLVPGWRMPAWIWSAQIAEFSRHYRVIAFDPRSQGESEIAPSGYEPGRRGRDIAELIRTVDDQPVLLVGWSLGVLDALAYVHLFGDSDLAGLVLVDNSVGEDPAPAPVHLPHQHPPRKRPPREVMARDSTMRSFVRSMFRRPQPDGWLDRLTEACLRTPEPVAAALLSYPVPRSYWKEAVYSTSCPVLYVVTPRFAGQAANLAAHHPAAEIVVMQGVGHALFVDDPARFDTTVQSFIHRRIWP